MWRRFGSVACAVLLATWSRGGRCEEGSPFPNSPHIKGLQVQMVDDALKLDVRHAGINFVLSGLYADPGDASAATWESGGKTFRFSKAYLESIDRSVKPLSDAGVIVYLIVLAMPTGQEAIDRLVIHPDAGKSGAYTVAAFNTQTKEGQAWLRAALEFVMDHYSGAQAPGGRVWGWILGNEVNSHFMWHNRGPCTLEELTDGYERALRIAHQSLRKASKHARVYLSLDHHWTGSITPQRPENSVSGKGLLGALATLVRERGDFDWHVAYHPYHSNLFSSELWNDPQAKVAPDAAKVTFHNLEVLCRYMERPELAWEGKPRRVILSEQGFHSDQTAEGEARQAAAYAYAWEKCRRLPMIDAFIYHRHVDHSQEGGLRLGLWRNVPGSVADPQGTKPIYELFRKAGTPQWDEAAGALLPLTGMRGWDEVMRGE
ncbi:MAG: hypothetical protein RI963_3766 [Planctomycetota bacterium]